MEHPSPLITTITAGFGVALFFGFAAEKLKVSALVGYLFAGILIGPETPGFVADVHISPTPRALNPEIEIAVRTRNEDEARLLRKDGIGMVFLGVEELARGLIEPIAQRFPPAATDHRPAGDSGQA